MSMTAIIRIFLFTILGIFIFLILLFVWVINNPDPNYICPPPDKPECAPTEAIWSGGCDGGYWLEFVSDSCNHFRFRVYLDWNGDLLLDALFAPETEESIHITKENWKNLNPIYSSGYEMNNYISIGDSIHRTYLKIVYPAYGGSDWEITIDKYKLYIPKAIKELPVYREETLYKEDYEINYRMYENGEGIPAKHHYENGETILHRYEDISLFLRVKKDNKEIINKLFQKDDFKEFVADEIREIMAFTSFYYTRSTPESITFILNLCQPDTDYCFKFEITFLTTGEMFIELLPDEPYGG